MIVGTVVWWGLRLNRLFALLFGHAFVFREFCVLQSCSTVAADVVVRDGSLQLVIVVLLLYGVPSAHIL